MAEHLIIIDRLSDWKAEFPRLPIVSAKDYLDKPEIARERGLHVLNLCRSYRYLSIGYYCSLLGEARQHKIMPSVRTINDLSRKAIYSLDFDDLDAKAQTAFGVGPVGLQVTVMEMDIFFGQCASRPLQELARQLFDAFRAPLMRIEFRQQEKKWRLHAVKALQLQTLSPEQETQFINALTAFVSKRWQKPRTRRRYRYDLAILQNPKEVLPPSDSRALKQFIRAGNRLGIDVELIERKDFSRLGEFDGLFIRETTAIDHYTYQFAKKAEREGLVVIDDPDSILKCTNKVYLDELLRANRISTPKTVILSRDNLDSVDHQIQYPIVLKIPDGSFSRGVFKVESHSELRTQALKLFKSSELLLAQEYLYTEFDWRIGVLNKKTLYACQYFMSKQHWQIYNHSSKKGSEGGGFQTFGLEDTPELVLQTAIKAANLIGDSLYGVDLKQTEKGVVVIEVNDNPNIDAGVEDLALKDGLYHNVMEEFLRRMERKRL